MTEKEIALSDTKRRILEVSKTLFSRHGYDGTSIRKIAQESGVNVAAVNYHFKNKETLFWEIIEDAHAQTEQVVLQAQTRTSTLSDMAMAVFDHFYSEGDSVRNTMRLFLAEELPPENSEVAGRLRSTFGPPGGQAFAERLQSEIPYEFTPENLFWGVKTIFGGIIHWSMMCSAARFKQGACPNPMLTPQQVRKDVERMIVATIEYIRNHPEIFNSKGE